MTKGLETEVEKQITEGLAELKDLLDPCTTYSVVGTCFARFLRPDEANPAVTRLQSPGRQIPFLLAVLLASPEPKDPIEFDAPKWDRTVSVLNRLFSAYFLLYVPTETQMDKVRPEWHRIREVSSLAFLHFFNTGLLASVQQLKERIDTYVVPFDDEVKSLIGIGARDAVAISDFLSEKLQRDLDDFREAVGKEEEQPRQFVDRVAAENWLVEKLRRVVAEDKDYASAVERVLGGLQQLGLVSLDDIRKEHPAGADAFWNRFTISRGEGPPVRYPTEQSVFALRPLILVDDTTAMCISSNSLFDAVLRTTEFKLTESSIRDNFLRARDRSLEKEALGHLTALFGSEATVLAEVYETPDGHYEHDFIVFDQEICVVAEAKATPPVEPFRDPDKAYKRIRHAFRSDGGLQKAYDQGNRIVRRLRNREEVPLYDRSGAECARLNPAGFQFSVGACITRDSFGPLATNLSLLLEKEPEDQYPWAVNVLDLATLADAWPYLGFGSREFRGYLEQRITLHGKVFSDDELDYAGSFVQHGGLDGFVAAEADLVQLDPDYSSVFDRIYEHLHLGGPPVTIEPSKPVWTDMRRSLAAGEPVFLEPGPPSRRGKKIGRNEPCPCGSGKKYKRCCGR